MARSRFGGTSADFVYDTVLVDSSRVVPHVGPTTCTFWTARAGGTQYTDILDTNLVATGGVVNAAPDGHLPIIYGPDGVLEMWVEAGGESRWLMTTTDAANLTGAVTAATAAQTAAASSATAASSSAGTAATLVAAVNREAASGIAGLDASLKLTSVNRLPDAARPRTLGQPVGQGELVFNVKDAPYSAPNNGVNDDSTAINAAITAANTAGGGDVLVPWSATNYMLGASIALKANVRLILAGNLKMLAANTSRAIAITNISNVAVEGRPGGGVIDLNKAAIVNGANNLNQQAISATYNAAVYTGLTITGLTVKNGHQRGLAVTALTAGGSISDVLIERNIINDVGEASIYVGCLGNVDKTTPSVSRRVTIQRNSLTATAAGTNGIIAFGCSDITIERNTLDGGGVASGHGICMGTSGTQRQATDFHVTQNTIRGYTGTSWGIIVTVNGTRFTIARNIVSGNNGGISVDPEDGAAVGVEVNVAGSIIDNKVYDSTANNGINARMCNGLTIAQNHSKGNYLNGLAVATATGVGVHGNNVHNNGSNGIAFFGTGAGGGHLLGMNRSTANNTRAVGGVNLYTDALPTAVQTISGIAAGLVGFYGATPIAKQTLPAAGVVTAADIRTALINLGLAQ